MQCDIRNLHIVVGARPNYMKMAPLLKAIGHFPERYHASLIHTGQHYDQLMNDVFFQILELPSPDVYLGVGSATHGKQTAQVLEQYEACLLEQRPDMVLVAGDVNSTLACALAAVKLQIPVAHVEAGLRSFDRTMPEEINRILTDRISDLLLTPSADGDANLLQEGTEPSKIHFVGNIMIDSLVSQQPRFDLSNILEELQLCSGEYALVTLHRPANVDNAEGLTIILQAFAQIGRDLPIVFPVHPRTRKNIERLGCASLLETIPNLRFIDPLGYLDFMKLQKEAKIVITDSGGVQEETTFFGVSCLTIRPNTERPITITHGTNRLVELNTDSIVRQVNDILAHPTKFTGTPELWDGHTAMRIVEVLDQYFGFTPEIPDSNQTRGNI